jgi:spore maturation protein CgeB
LQPSYINHWENLDGKDRPTDILFYGQYLDRYFSNRNEILQSLLKWLENRPYIAKIHLQYYEHVRPYVDRRIIRRFTRFKKTPPKLIRDRSLPGIYGDDLYKAIGSSKIVINCFGDYSGLHKDNMRIYEAISGGALLISEDGIYPEGLIPGEDFLSFQDTQELFSKIDYALSLPDQGRSIAERTREKLSKLFSKSQQWSKFQEVVNLL